MTHTVEIERRLQPRGRPWFRFLAPALLVLGLAPPALADPDPRPPWDFSPADRDTTVAPCEDFYAFANGGWLERNPIPADRTSWSSYAEIIERTSFDLRAIAEEAASRRATAEEPILRHVGTIYATCMDTVRAEREGAQPILPMLARIERIESRDDLAREIALLHADGLFAAFYYGASNDPTGSRVNIGELWQNGIELPTPDDYFEPPQAELRSAYRRHLEGLFALTGRDGVAARRAAERTFDLETILARATMTRLEMREPDAIVNVREGDAIEEIAPGFDWGVYFQALGTRPPRRFNVGQPRYFLHLDSLLVAAPLADWKSYLASRVLLDSAPYLDSEFRALSRAFARALGGAEEEPPRWRFCLDALDVSVGQGFGVVYAKRHFPPDAERRAHQMIDDLLAVMRSRIARSAWMTESTRRNALLKLDSLDIQIGRPEKLPDYARLTIPETSLYLQLLAAGTFLVAEDLETIGHPDDEGEWFRPAYHYGGYYSQSQNVLVYPAAKFQVPFYDAEADDPVNYGAIGSTLGHEILHALDDEGRRYDPSGDLRDWWSPADERAFRERAEVLVQQFDAYPVLDSLRVDGRLTLGENIADLGGVTISYYALQRALERSGRHETVGGWTPEQRFFLSWARNWRRNLRPERESVLHRADPHSPARWRTNGPLSNLPEFARAFGCAPGEPMVRAEEERARIW